MRLFLAFQLDPDMRRALQDIQEDFRRAGVRGNFTPPENLHLTLAFIGEVPDPEPVLSALFCVPFEPFPLRLEGVGAFGDLWWAGLAPNPALEACVRRLRRALAQAGVPFDRKRFSPHITLIRRAVPGPRGMPGVQPPPAVSLADHVALMRSDRVRGGVRYTEIREP